MKKKLCLLLSLVILFTCIPANVHAAKKVKLSETSIRLEVGDYYDELYLRNAKKKVTWKSSNKNIVSVKQNGDLLAKAVGTVTITAKCNKKSYKCKVRVFEEVHKEKLEETIITHSKGALIKVKNNNNSPVFVSYEVYFLKAGKVVKTDDFCYNDCIAANSEVFIPVNCNKEFDDCQIGEKSCYLSSYDSRIKYIKQTFSRASNYKYLVEVENTYSKKIGEIEMICVMYDKDNNIIKVDSDEIYGLKSKASDTFEFYYPSKNSDPDDEELWEYDDFADEDIIVPDHFEVFVTYAH